MSNNFIKKANLPEFRVKTVVIGQGNIQAKLFLSSLDINVLEVTDNPKLDVEISTHADVLVSHLGNGEILLSQNQNLLKAKLLKLGARVEEAEIIPFSPYPNDILLNHTILGDFLICNVKNTSKYVLKYAQAGNFTVIDTKQGYAKCSICIVEDNAVITEDSGIERLLKKYQIDVLKIQPNCIRLSDKHFGFLGGSSGKISKKLLFFNGNLKKHPDYIEIVKFLKKYNVEPIYDDSYELTDIGSIIPLTESVD